MKTFRALLVLLVALMLVPSFASAQSFYAAVRGGPGWTPDFKQGKPGDEDTFSFNTGFTGSGAVGYRLPWSLRAEGEFGYIWAPIKTDRGVDVNGSIKSYLFMANAYYDLALGFLGPVKPYVGFGLGVARVNEDHQVLLGPGPGSLAPKVDVDDWRTSFAYQARLGVTYDVNRWLDLSAGYRYVHVDGGTPRFQGQPVSFFGMSNHSAEFGFAVKF